MLLGGEGSSFFSRSYFLGGVGWLGKKGGIPFSPCFFLSHSKDDLTRIFSQENILKKSMSFFGATKHGKFQYKKLT